MPKYKDWSTEILLTSALHNEGIEAVWQAVGKHRDFMTERGLLANLRREQMHSWFHTALRDGLLDRLYRRKAKQMQALLDDMDAGRKTPHQCADELIAGFMDDAP